MLLVSRSNAGGWRARDVAHTLDGLEVVEFPTDPQASSKEPPQKSQARLSMQVAPAPTLVNVRVRPPVAFYLGWVRQNNVQAANLLLLGQFGTTLPAKVQ